MSFQNIHIFKKCSRIGKYDHGPSKHSWFFLNVHEINVKKEKKIEREVKLQNKKDKETKHEKKNY